MPGVIDRDGAIHESILATMPDGEKLLAERADVVAKLAPLRARYGGNGYQAEREFKVVEARLSAAERARQESAYASDRAKKEADRAGVAKPTEGSIDDAVRTNTEYTEALTRDIAAKTQWVELEEQLNAVEWRLRMRNGDAYLLAQEMKLQ